MSVVEICQQVTGTSRDRGHRRGARCAPRASEVEILLSDPSLAAELLGWTPTTSLEDGLRAEAEWLAPRVDAATAVRYQR